MSIDYHFVTVWPVAGTVDEVAAALDDGPSLTRWWPSVYLSVLPLQEGAPDGVGRVAELHTTGWLPYTLRWGAPDHRAGDHGRIRARGDR